MDTYEKIAKQLNVTVDQIKSATQGKRMFIGQRITFWAFNMNDYALLTKKTLHTFIFVA